MPEPDSIDTAISAGVERAIARLLGDSGDSSDFYAAVRQGVRDAVWHLGTAANATDTADSERSHGHAD